VKYEEIYVFSSELIDHRLIQISTLVDTSVMHVAVAAAIGRFGSDQYFFSTVVQKHCAKLCSLGFYKKAKVVDSVLLFPRNNRVVN